MEPNTDIVQRKCPDCGSEKISRSRRRGFDHVAGWSGGKPFRCQSCRKRFYLCEDRSPGAGRERRESRDKRRMLMSREVLVYSAAMLIFCVVVFLITRERG